jgi:hypothetical protein
MRRSLADARRPIVRDAVVIVVGDDDFKRAPILGGDGPAAPIGSPAEHEARLRATVGPGRVVGAHWPVCCGGLATLVVHHGAGESTLLDEPSLTRCILRAAAEESDPSFDAGLAEWSALLESVRQRCHGGDGISLFRCRRCGRVYGSYSEP